MTDNAQDHPLKSLAEHANNYIETRIDLIKMKAVDKSSTALSSLISSIIIILGVFLFLFILCIGLSFYLGELLGKVYYGFFIVGGFFSLAVIILYICREKWI